MIRKLAVKIDGRERIVELGDDTVRVDGWTVDVQVVAAGPGVWVLRQGNEQTLAQVDATGGTGAKLTVELRRPGSDAVVVATEVADARRAAIVAPARPGGDAAPVIVRSPIPGRLVKVLVKVGDRVTAGQTLVVLEAMKMENELRAPRAGQVTAVRGGEGTAVEAGQDLVTVG